MLNDKNELNNEQVATVNGGTKDEVDKFTYEEYFEAGIILTPNTWSANTYTIVCGKSGDYTYDYTANITKACAEAVRSEYNRILTKEEFLTKFYYGIIK